MSAPFEALEERLLRAGIAPRHVKRYLRELEDHLDDLAEAQRAAGHDGDDANLRARALLGPDDELAAAMNQPRFRALAARAPWLVFTVLPPLATLLCLAVPVLLLAGVAEADKILFGHDAPAPDWFRHFSAGLAAAANFSAMPLAALLLAVIAWRQRLAAGWLLLGVAMLLPLVANMQSYFPNPADIAAHKKGCLSLGMGLSFSLDALTGRDTPRLMRDLLILLPTAALVLGRRWILAKVPEPA